MVIIYKLEKVCSHFFKFSHRRYTMNETKLATQTVRIQYWTEVIHDRNQSGLTVADYCDTHGLSYNAYYYWLRKLRKSALESSGIDFVELPDPVKTVTQDSKTDFDTEAMLEIGSVNIAINSHTSKALLRAILEVAQDVK